MSNHIAKPFLTTVSTSRFEGKVAIITASTEGIGYAIAERLAKEGAAVVISSRNKDNVDKALKKLRAKGLKVEGTVCHVSNAEQRSRLFDTATAKFGGVDILISNAAVNPGAGSLLKTPDEIWDKVFEVNVKNSWQLTKEVIPHMLKRGGGSIVYIGSIVAYDPLKVPMGLYSVSKTTLLGLVKAVANEIGPYNIRVNGLASGGVPTTFSQMFLRDGDEWAKNLTSLKRLGKAEEIAAAATFLVSSDADYITGETLVVAGGVTSHL